MRKKSISSKGNIPLLLYKKILGLMPIPCVDLVFKSGNDVYLFKRSYEPAKNEWWLVGGRINRWETFEEAAVRKAKEEIGVDVKIIKIIGMVDDVASDLSSPIPEIELADKFSENESFSTSSTFSVFSSTTKEDCFFVATLFEVTGEI